MGYWDRALPWYPNGRYLLSRRKNLLLAYLPTSSSVARENLLEIAARRVLPLPTVSLLWMFVARLLQSPLSLRHRNQTGRVTECVASYQRTRFERKRPAKSFRLNYS